MKLNEDYKLAEAIITLLELYRPRLEEYRGDQTVNELVMHVSIAELAARRWRLEIGDRIGAVSLKELADAGDYTDGPCPEAEFELAQTG